MISIVDYGMGNLRSVEKAFNAAGYECELITSPEQVAAATRLVVPGVGAFGDAMKGLHQQGLVEPIRQFAASGRPMFGICLGMQILFDSSEEAPGVEGLGIIAGSVKRFQPGAYKVPHMGWNV